MKHQLNKKGFYFRKKEKKRIDIYCEIKANFQVMEESLKK